MITSKYDRGAGDDSYLGVENLNVAGGGDTYLGVDGVGGDMYLGVEGGVGGPGPARAGPPRGAAPAEGDDMYLGVEGGMGGPPRGAPARGGPPRGGPARGAAAPAEGDDMYLTDPVVADDQYLTDPMVAGPGDEYLGDIDHGFDAGYLKDPSVRAVVLLCYVCECEICICSVFWCVCMCVCVYVCLSVCLSACVRLFMNPVLMAQIYESLGVKTTSDLVAKVNKEGAYQSRGMHADEKDKEGIYSSVCLFVLFMWIY